MMPVPSKTDKRGPESSKTPSMIIARQTAGSYIVTRDEKRLRYYMEKYNVFHDVEKQSCKLEVEIA